VTALDHHRPRKRFGQNFLVDRNCIARILAAIDPGPQDRMVEIGPGRGALTSVLTQRLEHLHVIEIDRDLAARLANEYPADRLTLHTGDALKFDFAALGTRLRIVGNLPYNVSTPLLFRLIECCASIVDVHVMLQREVVDRMVAAPGSPDYGRLTVMLGYRFATERLFRVPAGAFYPQPKVESAFARLRPIETPEPRALDERLFARIVTLAFGQRRKTLRNTLAGVAAAVRLATVGIYPQARGETLSIGQFVTLANEVASTRAAGEAAS